MTDSLGRVWSAIWMLDAVGHVPKILPLIYRAEPIFVMQKEKLRGRDCWTSQHNTACSLSRTSAKTHSPPDGVLRCTSPTAPQRWQKRDALACPIGRAR